MYYSDEHLKQIRANVLHLISRQWGTIIHCLGFSKAISFIKMCGHDTAAPSNKTFICPCVAETSLLAEGKDT